MVTVYCTVARYLLMSYVRYFNWCYYLLLADVAVLNSATLKDLKLAIRKKTDEIEQAKMGHRHISWYCSQLINNYHATFFVVQTTKVILIPIF